MFTVRAFKCLYLYKADIKCELKVFFILGLFLKSIYFFCRILIQIKMTENDKATAIQIIYSDTTHISRVYAVSPLRQEAKDDRHITCEYARMIRRSY